MKCILVGKEEFDLYALNANELVVFNDKDEYTYFEEFDHTHTRDQIRVCVEEYVVRLKALD